MKHSIWIAGLLLLMVIGCREESDSVLSYAYRDKLAFQKADSSFAGKFDVFWNGMNTNYAMWDFEKENGLDWDEVYVNYYPRFAALDAVDTLVSDKQLSALLNEVVEPLHDGHLYIQMKNHVTGNSVIGYPGLLRLLREREKEFYTIPDMFNSLPYYISSGEVLETKQALTDTFVSDILSCDSYVKAVVNTLSHKTDRTPEEENMLTHYSRLNSELTEIVIELLVGNTKGTIEKYNEIALRYEYLQIPLLVPVDKNLNKYAINISYALFKGNIAYLSFSHFSLSAYLNPSYRSKIFETPSAHTQELIDGVVSTWQAWFDAIQAHHKAGDLGGVIIDLRSNGGGFMEDFEYVLGALIPSGSYHVMDVRFKRGPGRYDYSPVMPQFFQTMNAEHVTVTEPIVALCNCRSVSMSEHTSLGVKNLDNGFLIGTRTWGGCSALTDSERYSDNYSGYVGIMDETPVFCYIPQELAFTLDGRVLEGYGITPNIEIDFDVEAWKYGNGPDSQLDRALQYIRNGH